MGHNFTLYVNNDNEGHFEKEPNKGSLVNSLLSSYYSGNITLTGMNHMANVSMSTSNFNEGKTVGSSSLPKLNTCPNGHLLNAYGKCLTKDCKYSK